MRDTVVVNRPRIRKGEGKSETRGMDARVEQWRRVTGDALRYAVRHAPHPSPENGIARVNVDIFRIEKSTGADVDHDRLGSDKAGQENGGKYESGGANEASETFSAVFDPSTKIGICEHE